MNQRKIRAVMFGMAAHAILSGRIPPQPNGVHAEPLRDSFANLLVAIHALQKERATAEFMTLRAIQLSGKKLMRVGKRTGRYLCMARSCEPKAKQHTQQKQNDPRMESAVGARFGFIFSGQCALTND
jgi:hypothetical protein